MLKDFYTAKILDDDYKFSVSGIQPQLDLAWLPRQPDISFLKKSNETWRQDRDSTTEAFTLLQRHQNPWTSSWTSSGWYAIFSFLWLSRELPMTVSCCGYDVAADKWCMLGLCQSARRQKSSGFTTTPAWQQSPPLVKYVLAFAHLVNLPFVNCVGLPRQLTKAVTSPGSAELALVKHTISMHVTHHFDHCILN